MVKGALIQRLEILIKEKNVRDKLARRKQVKDVSIFNEDFKKIYTGHP